MQPPINSPFSIQIRDRVELSIAAGETTAVFSVRVQDIWDDGIVVDRPIIDQRLMPAPPGKAVEVIFQRQDATYSFASRIVRESVLERLPVLVIEQPREFVRIQKREHFRLDIELPIHFRKLRAAGGEAITPYLPGMAVNLSAGGVKFSAELPDGIMLEANEVVQLSFSLTNTYSIAGVEAFIIKADHNPRIAHRLTLTCRFLNIPANIQEAIIVHNIRYQQRYRIEPRGR